MEVPFRGISLAHQQAPVDIRELIYLPEDVCKNLLSKFNDLLGVEEVLIFSTCNRTEVYYLAEQDLSKEIIQILTIEKGIPDGLQYLPYFKVFEDELASVRHLFEVSIGLQSKVLGDLQIANQIKTAYNWSHQAGRAGAFMHRLLHTIFHTNKRVQQETPYRDGAASASYAAAELAVELSNHLIKPKAMVIGLGEMGLDVARNLDLDFFEKVSFSNRTFSKAEALAQELGAFALPYTDIHQHLAHYDVLISAVSAPSPIIYPEVLAAQSLRSKFVIDLSMPRSVDPTVEQMPQVIVYNIDDVHTRTEATLARRKGAIPQVHRIIDEEIIEFMEWRKELSLSPTIHLIKSALENIRREELAKYSKKASPKESELMDTVTRSIMNKIMRIPVLQLKEACKRGNSSELIDLIHELFDLEAKKIKQSRGK